MLNNKRTKKKKKKTMTALGLVGKTTCLGSVRTGENDQVTGEGSRYLRILFTKNQKKTRRRKKRVRENERKTKEAQPGWSGRCPARPCRMDLVGRYQVPALVGDLAASVT
ncbi:hypothetical protein RUM44_013632 [Polyplax serrata]|uniref:Uncharacterized protein n=1 Tax=Polyplax serrata TaxID=468196 RepID=A0ABR1BID6_POLSC